MAEWGPRTPRRRKEPPAPGEGGPLRWGASSRGDPAARPLQRTCLQQRSGEEMGDEGDVSGRGCGQALCSGAEHTGLRTGRFGPRTLGEARLKVMGPRFRAVGDPGAPAGLDFRASAVEPHTRVNACSLSRTCGCPLPRERSIGATDLAVLTPKLTKHLLPE